MPHQGPFNHKYELGVIRFMKGGLCLATPHHAPSLITIKHTLAWFFIVNAAHVFEGTTLVVKCSCSFPVHDNRASMYSNAIIN